MVRTFLDSGVLLAAARLANPGGERAIEVLQDRNRNFLTSPFVALELMPKATFHKRHLEAAFYQEYFSLAEWTRDLHKIEAEARIEAARSGLSALDALHLAAAHLARADEFLTAERPGKPMYRSTLVKVVYLFD